MDNNQDTRVFENEKPASGKKKWVNPIRIFRERLTDESLDDDTAKYMVNVLGVIGGLAFIIAVGVAAVIIYTKFSSFSSQYEKAVEYETVGDVSKAASCYEKAIEAANKKTDRIAARMALAKLYLDQNSKTNAAVYFEQVVDIDKQNEEAIRQLLTIYEENNDMASILALAKKASAEETEALFADYLLTQPVFNYKSGTYDEALTIEITAGSTDRIYYTMDDTEATEMSKLYTGPIQLEEGHTVFHAMAISDTGLMSQNIVVNYEIIASAPQTPKISPNSGTYRELTKVEAEIPDGCRAYYTLDGSVPTAESPEFTGSIQLPLGNHIFSLVFVNQNGLYSEVATKVYDFIFSAPVTRTEAVSIVRDGLVESGELLNGNGDPADVSYGKAEFYCNDIISINETQYYRVDKIYSGQGPSGSYAVEIKTGAVFSLLDNNGNYTLTGF